MTDPTETPNLNKVLEEIENLKWAAQLLESVWVHIGPYNQLPDDLSEQLRQYFRFDDSE